VSELSAQTEPFFEPLARNSIAGLVLALLCAASMWFYVDHVQIPHQIRDSRVHDVPRGNLSDLYPRWLGSRELLLRHRNPYSPEITREIQRGYYGRELDLNRPNDPIDQQGFAYPVYVAFLLAPTVRFPFGPVRAAFHWFLVAVTVVSVWLWFTVLGWKTTLSTYATVAVLLLGSFPAVQGLKLQQLTLLTAFLAALSVALITRGRLFLAGVVLAIATIKPQLVLLLLVCLCVWALGDWTQRKNLWWGFAATMAVLLGASQFVLPGWLSVFRSAMHAYRQYAGGPSIPDMLLPQPVGPTVSAVALLVLLLMCWRFRKAPADSLEFQYLVAGPLTITLLVIPKFSPYNQVFLLPVVLLIAREWRPLWRKSLPSKMACCLTAMAIGWPWLAALGLMFTSLVLSPEHLDRAWTVPLITTLAVPVALLIQLGWLVRAAWPAQATR